jgi:hypothetical protein
MGSRKTPTKPWVGAAACLKYADEALAQPPRKPWIIRVAPVGPLLWRCALPAALCKTENVYGRSNRWQYASDKKQLLELMLRQHGFQKRRAPVPGRPMVRCIRFTAGRGGDRNNTWSKIPIDLLVGDYVRVAGPHTKTPGKRFTHEGLNFLTDDHPEYVDKRCWWEPGPGGNGFVLLEVFAGML